MEETVTIVCGRKLESVRISHLRERALTYRRIIMDLGTGDGRWPYRLARRHPDWFCVGIDSNAAGMREASFRAGRKPNRGGVGNIVFVRAAVEALPHCLADLADEIHINFPWGSLLRVVVRPDPAVLACIARLGKRGAALHVHVNISALQNPVTMANLGLPERSPPELFNEIIRAYESAGFESVTTCTEVTQLRASWGKQLGQGRAVPILAINATVSRIGFSVKELTTL